MSDAQPDTPVALTAGQIMNALRIRNEVAERMNRVNRSTSRGEKVSIEAAKVIAERLIELGYIDTAKVHDAIVSEKGEPNEGVDDLFDD
tara:strand:+ start:6901 stop:7167 length:267 start_codon:yes stop_codon:yes gene_type:complete